MRIFSDLKLGARILMGFVVVAIVAAVIGIIGDSNINKIDNRDTMLYEDMTVPMSNLYNMNQAFLKIRIDLRDLIYTTNAKDWTKFQLDIKSNNEIFDKNFADFKKTNQDTTLADNLTTAKAAYDSIVNQIMALDKENKDDQAIALLNGDGVTVSNNAALSMQNLTQSKIKLAKKTSDDNSVIAKTSINLMNEIIIAGALIAVFLGVLVSRSITKPIKKLVDYADRIAVGDIDIEIHNETKDEIGALMSAFKKMVENINDQVNAVEKIALGDLNITLKVKSEKDIFGKNLISMTQTIKELLTETSKLIKATQEGKLDTRGNAELFKGAWGELVIEINKLIDAFVEPINVTAEYVNRISKGDIPKKITDNYNGDFNEIKNNLNSCIDVMNGLLTETNKLIKATQEGKLDTRGNSDKFNGGWGELVIGINEMIDAFVIPINVTSDYVDKISKGNIPSKITDTYKGDFNTIKNNLNLCIDSINLLLLDAGNLVEAAVEGKLSTRADASKHSGDYKRIVEGVNNTLDAVIEPVKEAALVLHEMANGNLSLHVKGDYKGDHADIKNALNDTLNSFNALFTEISNAADQVSGGSNQVSDGSQALSQGTTEQASAIEELTVSITEVAAQTKQNAVNAIQANELALNSKEGATIGNSHMKDMLKSMEEINESSSDISKIIKVIDDIAFQTNILALNAAVEAARAGQHGKGFAVVAEEVRNLAARSANAAKQTTDLIEGSIKKVEIGTKIANSTAESLDQIVVEVSKAATLVGDIAVASNEQATAIAQINKGIEQVSNVVQTNSATAEQSAAASEELSSQASMLKSMVEKFRLKSGAFLSSNEVSLRTHGNSKQVRDSSLSYAEAATAKSEPRISLSDIEFGKY